ncbi:MAG: hypothetical protein Fur0032_13150 [Terrimicrobiaceae bacterium]
MNSSATPPIRCAHSSLIAGLMLWLAACLVVQAQGIPQVTASALRPYFYENWPSSALVVFRRDLTTGPLDVHVTLSGTATPGTDYQTSLGAIISFGDGDDEVVASFAPLTDNLTNERTESVVVTVAAGGGYIPAPRRSQVVLSLFNADQDNRPSHPDAIRFLEQSTFGTRGDSPSDRDWIPEDAEEVRSLGFPAWLKAQFRTPHKTTAPVIKALRKARKNIWGEAFVEAWWETAMTGKDRLRQRVTFALSEILVISARAEAINNTPEGMADYYDMLGRHAFGNYRDLLLAVARHPCMGVYLSHLKNRKADPAMNIYPDENFAREIMQLFTIGLWELNPDGTRKLDGDGQPIPAYDNTDIQNFARVFTGLSFGGPGGNQFWWPPQNFTSPMRMWDEYHDTEAKELLNGEVLPARTASSDPDTGAAGLADIEAAINNLFNHPNVGPFLGRQLIQRLVTSNPTPEYVGRVASAFNDNGRGVRGDLQAVITAILLDPEARSPLMLDDAAHGKLREPLLRGLGFARALDSRSASGRYSLRWQYDTFLQEPLHSPSVFNFFLPTYTPAGELRDNSLVAPEFQILNANTSFSIPNWINGGLEFGFNYWQVQENRRHTVLPALAKYEKIAHDTDTLLAALDLAMTANRLTAEELLEIRDALEEITEASLWGGNWRLERARAAAYLISSSAAFNIQR